MARSMIMRLLVAVVLIAAEMAAVTALLVVAPTPAGAQLFEDLFPFFRNNRRGWFAPPEREERAPDYSKAPAPKKTDAVPQMPIMVFGDSMADWLAYGLEQAYADTPEIGILRRHRTSSGLIRTEARNDPRGEYPDWPLAAKEMIAAQKPKFVVMMIGMNDRQTDQGSAATPAREAGASSRSGRRRSRRAGTRYSPNQPRPPLPRRPRPAATKLSNSAPMRGARLTSGGSTTPSRHSRPRVCRSFGSACRHCGPGASAADIPFLNDLYRSRSDKAGIVYVDVWDGFVDEDGRFAQSGPDFEGQTRRLRAGDGVYFTQAGARKLAHFVEREIDRWLSARAASVALPVEDTKAATSASPELAEVPPPGKPA